MKLKGDKIYLRSIDQQDAETVLMWENDPSNWEVSENDSSYSLQDIYRLIEDLKDTQSAGQIRYMIVHIDTDLALGTMDLAEIDFTNGVAWVGVLIADEKQRRNGFASESLRLIEDVALSINVNMLKAKIHLKNTVSRSLFEKCGYQLVKDQPTEKNADYLNTVIYSKWLGK